jgi:hypothetical protein
MLIADFCLAVVNPLTEPVCDEKPCFVFEAETGVSFRRLRLAVGGRGLGPEEAQPAPDLITSWAQALELRSRFAR